MKTIQLHGKYGKGQLTMVDDDFIFPSGTKHMYLLNSGYVAISTGYKPILLHRYVSGAPTGLQTHHINNNPLDNRKQNLKICDQSMNNQWINSPHRGVHWFKRTNKWRAGLQFKKKAYHIGYFDNLKDAIIAYNKKARSVYGLEARVTAR